MLSMTIALSEITPKTFEQLWEEAEQLTAKRYKHMSHEQLVKEITDLLAKYAKINLLGGSELIGSLKNRLMGETLFALAALTLKDNLNIHPILQEQVIVNS
jgi:uncharacterized protein with von Willebrand factor type A (vWA) domain